MVREFVGMVMAVLMAVPGASIYTTVPLEPVEPMAVVAAFGENFNIERFDRGEFRAVWVTTVINLDWPSRQGLSNAELMREIDYIVEHSRSIGLNAIILQVRPEGDAIYPSNIFPWSRFLSGEQGIAPADGFDPLAYWIERAHANGLELHAWINPYRVTHTTTRITDVNLLHSTNPARQRPHLVRPNETERALYLDPGFPESRDLIVAGVAELLRNYPMLDGIHLDDYFYPRNFDDSRSWEQFGGNMDRNEWRRENVNSLIRDLQATVHEISPHARFGISPTGIWANRSAANPQGSNTRGNEHLVVYHADSVRWIQEGWIDYIVPQIYWHIGFDIACYEILLRWWEDVVRGTDVNLYIGHAAWREHEGQNHFNGEMMRQLQMNSTSDVVQGSVFFRWSNLQGNLGYQIRDWYAARPTTSPNVAIPTPMPTPTPPPLPPPDIVMTELAVSFPASNVTVRRDWAGHNVLGTSVPHLPLYLNGELVENRTREGFFSVFVPLSEGVNRLEFTQPGMSAVVRTITRSGPATTPPATTQQPAAQPTPTPRPGREFGSEELYYATVTAEAAWMYPGSTTVGATNWMLSQGQRDRVTAVSQNDQWLRLSNGGWIQAANTEFGRSRTSTENILRDGIFNREGHIETVSWSFRGSNAPAARTVWYPDERRITVFFGMQTVPPPMRNEGIPSDSFFENMYSGMTADGIAYWSFILQEGVRLEGHDITPIDNNRLQFTVMTRRPLYPNPMAPFTGFTFVLDAGHGGSDPGAIGPMGAALPESEIVLINALKLGERLERLGARVVYTRTEDVDVSLRDRVMLSREVQPDMFISLHANSVAETTNATTINGFTIWYRNDNSYPLATLIMQQMQRVNPLTNRWPNPNQSNLYVVRPTWTPSILLESSFMSNIDDFAWMITERYQNQLADETVAALLVYYGRR